MTRACSAPPLVGLSGGIGSGKSTVARLFASHGVPTLDTDVIYRDLLASDPELAEGIAALFGPGVLDAHGRVDRAALRARLAADPAGFAPLEALAHPLILAEVGRRSSLARTCAAFVLVEVPLLFEAGLEAGFAATVYVTAPVEERFARVAETRGLPRVRRHRGASARARGRRRARRPGARQQRQLRSARGGRAHRDLDAHGASGSSRHHVTKSLTQLSRPWASSTSSAKP
jgi:dephospho-CoA kinase